MRMSGTSWLCLVGLKGRGWLVQYGEDAVKDQGMGGGGGAADIFDLFGMGGMGGRSRSARERRSEDVVHRWGVGAGHVPTSGCPGTGVAGIVNSVK